MALYSSIKFADDLKASEFVLNQDVATAMPVEVWVRLQPERVMIDSEYAKQIRYHLCDDTGCETNPRVRRDLHTNITTEVRCPVHKTLVTAIVPDGWDDPRDYICPDGHGWRETKAVGCGSHLVLIAVGAR